MNSNAVLDNVHAKFIEINRELLRVWLSEIVFSWRWWINLALTIIPWVVWIRYREKDKTIRFIIVGFAVALITEILDVIGMSYGLWHYDWPLIPIFPIYMPWNLSLFPVSVMFTIQVKPKVKPIIKAILYGVFAGYLMEPFFSKVGMYDSIKWSSFLSLVIYVPLYLFFNWLYKQTEKCEI